MTLCVHTECTITCKSTGQLQENGPPYSVFFYVAGPRLINVYPVYRYNVMLVSSLNIILRRQRFLFKRVPHNDVMLL